jgi:predicted ATPase with chaperone activity
VKPAIRNASLKFPQRRVAVNLAPAELPKDGTGFDLTNRVPAPSVAAGVGDHIWKIEEIVELLGA